MVPGYLLLILTVMSIWPVPCIWLYATTRLTAVEVLALFIGGETVIAMVMLGIAPPGAFDPAPSAAPAGYHVDLVVPRDTVATPAPTCHWVNDSVRSTRFCPGGDA